MSFPPALILAAAAAAPIQGDAPARGAVLAEARVTVQILSSAAVRQADGLQRDDDLPRHQLSRRGNTILIEFQ
jgi:hypothetical protein